MFQIQNKEPFALAAAFIIPRGQLSLRVNVRAISIGEVLWDLIGADEHLGGAPFNFAAHLRNLGHDVLFVSAVGSDARGKNILARMQKIGLPESYVRQVADYPTGTASVVLEGVGQVRFVINRPAAYEFPILSQGARRQLCEPAPDLIYFGTLFQMSSQARQLTMSVLDQCPSACRLYDVNLRPGNYDLELVRNLMERATVLKVNDEEVATLVSILGIGADSLEYFCRRCAQEFDYQSVCVTRGARGCALLVGENFVESPGYPVSVVDTVGAGDAFAAAFAHGLVSRWAPAKIADFANRVGALVASRAGATPAWTLEEVAALGR